LGGGETSFDLGLDVGNVGAGETLIHLSVQKSLYGMEHAEILLSSYVNILRSFLRNPATRVTWPELHSKDDIQRALAAGRGKLITPWSL
jgi:hybrid polyketide synthase/nonribosomal peptide synthetase ACE1